MTTSNGFALSHTDAPVCSTDAAPVAGLASVAINPSTDAAARNSRLDTSTEPNRGLADDRRFVPAPQPTQFRD
jgi:hypothetical protein